MSSKDNHFNKKSSLTNDEKHEFARMVKESDKRRKEQEKYDEIAHLSSDENVKNNYLNKDLRKKRKRILESFNFSASDLEIVDILTVTDFPDKNYLIMFYIITAFDHKAFVEKAISVDIGLQGKFLYIFGASIISEIDEYSKQTVFYKLAKKLFDFLQHSISNPNYRFTEILNHYLAIIGSLSLAVPYERKILGTNFTIGFNASKDSEKYCFVIPPENLKKNVFTELYDFYYKNVTKMLFKDISNLKDISSYKKVIDNKKMETGNLKLGNLKKALTDYDNTLASKLSSLKNRGGGNY